MVGPCPAKQFRHALLALCVLSALTSAASGASSLLGESQQEAWINAQDKDLAIRKSPDPSAPALGAISGRQSVGVLWQSTFTANLNGTNSSWLFIQFPADTDGRARLISTRGWVFGGDVALTGDGLKTIPLAKKEEDFEPYLYHMIGVQDIDEFHDCTVYERVTILRIGDVRKPPSFGVTVRKQPGKTWRQCISGLTPYERKSPDFQVVDAVGMGVYGDYVFFDIGSGPGNRHLVIHNMFTKKLIYDGAYFAYDDLAFTDGSDVAFYRQVMKPDPKWVCPKNERQKIEKDGFPVAFREKVMLDLADGRETRTGDVICYAEH